MPIYVRQGLHARIEISRVGLECLDVNVTDETNVH